MTVFSANQCAYSRSPILSEQGWAREKIYGTAPNGHDASYHCYHLELFAGQEGGCWEKHQMEQEIRRTTAYAA